MAGSGGGQVGTGESQPKRPGLIKGIVFLLAGLVLGGILGAMVLLSGPRSGSGTERRLPPTVGSPVKDFTLRSLEGQDVRLADLRGRPVVMNFWATWCAPCKEEMPLLNQYAEKYADQMVVLGVNSGEMEDIVAPFVEEYALGFPILMDTTNAVSDTYYVRSYPMTFFVDSEGVLRAQHLGMLSEKLLARYLETIGITP